MPTLRNKMTVGKKGILQKEARKITAQGAVG